MIKVLSVWGKDYTVHEDDIGPIEIEAHGSRGGRVLRWRVWKRGQRLGPQAFILREVLQRAAVA